ncbi:MAG TPA: hypothetical protein PK029_01005 [Bacteroidales bacterium]|nr:hypothetical protein [Bacteroidales bacterium]HPM11998.1 hypothetical protein [Bacteroidales bacterium]
MKKTVFFIAMLLTIATAASAQRANQKWYRHAIGVRGENSFYIFPTLVGVTYDRFLSNQTAVELILVTDLETGTEISGLYKYVKSIPDVPASVRWYAGIGAHFGEWDATDIVAGIDGILGIGYTFDQIPINATLDWHPIINAVTSNTQYIFVPTKFGLSARYIIE